MPLSGQPLVARPTTVVQQAVSVLAQVQAAQRHHLALLLQEQVVPPHLLALQQPLERAAHLITILAASFLTKIPLPELPAQVLEQVRVVQVTTMLLLQFAVCGNWTVKSWVEAAIIASIQFGDS
jgi:hypothetical protein